jgi:hypothetical protein
MVIMLGDSSWASDVRSLDPPCDTYPVTTSPAP